MFSLRLADWYCLSRHPHCGDFVNKREELGLTARDESDGGAGGRKRFGDGPSNAAGRACYQRLEYGSVLPMRMLP